MQDKLSDIANQYTSSVIQFASVSASPRMSQMLLEQTSNLLTKYQLKDQADRIVRALPEINKLMLGEIKTIAKEYKLTTEQIKQHEEFVKNILSDNYRTALKNIVTYYLSKKDKVAEQVDSLASSSIVMNIVPQLNIDHTGRHVSTLNTYDQVLFINLCKW